MKKIRVTPIAIFLLKDECYDELEEYLSDKLDYEYGEYEICDGGKFLEFEPIAFDDDDRDKELPNLYVTPNDLIESGAEVVQVWYDL